VSVARKSEAACKADQSCQTHEDPWSVERSRARSLYNKVQRQKVHYRLAQGHSQLHKWKQDLLHYELFKRRQEVTNGVADSGDKSQNAEKPNDVDERKYLEESCLLVNDDVLVD